MEKEHREVQRYGERVERGRRERKITTRRINLKGHRTSPFRLILPSCVGCFFPS